MKNTLFFIFFALILCSCNTKESVTIITGNIKGGMVENFTYTVPLNETIFDGFRDTIWVNPDGSFEISFSNKEIVFVNLSFRGTPDGYERPALYETKLIIEPGKDFVFNIDFEDLRFPWKVSGENMEAQMVYMTLPAPYHPSTHLRRLSDRITDGLTNLLKEEKRKEFEPFNELLVSGRISQKVYDAIELERNYFYALVEAYGLMSSLIEESPDPVSLHRIEEVFTKYPPVKEVLRSSFGYWYLQTYVQNFKVWIQDGYTRDKFREEVSNENKYTFYFNNGLKYLPPELHEYYQSTFIFQEALQKNYETELISLSELFKSNYPKSSYGVYLEDLINEIKEFKNITELPFKETMLFIEDPIHSFESLVERFKGKKLYIDVWATWCGPCKDEFKHKTGLKNYLKEQNMEILYISIDDDERAENWEKMIKFYDLEGTHIRAQSKELADQLRYMFSEGKGYISIPWYMLVDEDGNITEKHAKRPSQLLKE